MNVSQMQFYWQGLSTPGKYGPFEGDIVMVRVHCWLERAKDS